MSGHTANAGKAYFPGGTPDHEDIAGDAVDLEGSVRREVEEETGLKPEDLEIDSGWYAVFAGPRTGLMKPMRAREPANIVRRRVLDHLARQAQPELSDMLIVRGPADLDSRIPDFVVALLHYRWRLAKPGATG
jgi:8-oxo-dGTP pyrophosphatase MutT (NUDIX family)